MTTALAGPGPIRLQREAVRIVSIPYSPAFAQSPGQPNLRSTVTDGMGADSIVKKRTLKLRLEAPGVGFWKCPRHGHKGKELHHISRQGAPRELGYCQVEDVEGGGGKCGRRLVVEKTHWHEMAEAFGFLESQGDSYIHGKFGHLAKYLAQVNRPPYFDSSKAELALALESLLESHGDFVLPLLWVADSGEDCRRKWTDAVLEMFTNCLRIKKESYEDRSHPPHAGIAVLRKEVENKWIAFDPGEHEGVRRGKLHQLRGQANDCNCKRLLSKKVRESYVTRTRTFLKDLELMTEDISQCGSGQLTDLGTNLVAGLKQEGFILDWDSSHIPPGFEAIHDVLSIGLPQYERRFRPRFSRERIERILMRTVLPTVEPVRWERYRTELASILPRIVQLVGNRISNGARIDTVRSAMFLYQVGRGIPTILENTERRMCDVDMGVRSNAIVSIAGEDAEKYFLGSARVGRRLWSINLLRNPSQGG